MVAATIFKTRKNKKTKRLMRRTKTRRSEKLPHRSFYFEPNFNNNSAEQKRNDFNLRDGVTHCYYLAKSYHNQTEHMPYKRFNTPPPGSTDEDMVQGADVLKSGFYLGNFIKDTGPHDAYRKLVFENATIKVDMMSGRKLLKFRYESCGIQRPLQINKTDKPDQPKRFATMMKPSGTLKTKKSIWAKLHDPKRRFDLSEMQQSLPN